MNDHPFTGQLKLLQNNLALVEALFQRHPNLFSHVSHVQVDADKPRVVVWAWFGTPEEKQDIANEHREGNWKRIALRDRVDYSGEIAGVEFLLEGAEKPTAPIVTQLFQEA